MRPTVVRLPYGPRVRQCTAVRTEGQAVQSPSRGSFTCPSSAPWLPPRVLLSPPSRSPIARVASVHMIADDDGRLPLTRCPAPHSAQVVCRILMTAEFCKDTIEGLSSAIQKDIKPAMSDQVTQKSVTNL